MSNIQITPQETSNPKILKFEASSFLVQYNSFEYANIDEAKNSPLAQQLFYLPFVKKVYISGNFVAIERYDIVSWSDVQNEVAEQIQYYLNSGGLVVIEEKTKKNPITIYAGRSTWVLLLFLVQSRLEPSRIPLALHLEAMLQMSDRS